MRVKYLKEIMEPFDYKVIVDREIERGETLYKHNLIDVAADIRNALGGGECIRCGKTWARVDVKNKYGEDLYAEFTYWKPDCTCYPVCKKVVKMERVVGTKEMGTADIGCGRVLYEELDGAIHKDSGRHFVICDNCKTIINVDRFIRETV